MFENPVAKLKTFSPLHRRYLLAVLQEIVDYYDEALLGCAVFGSYARGDNRLNSDLDLLIILRQTLGLSQRVRQFVEAVEMKYEVLAQALYEEADILCELSPYILSREEAMKMQPIYYDLVENHLIIYDPAGLIAHIIKATGQILRLSGARKVWHGNAWEWQTGRMGFLGGTDL